MSDTKVALITAGGSGMGADSARVLAADGFKVGILSSSGKGEALAKELGGVGVTGTNKSEADIQMLVDAAMKHWGRVDVLVNSAWTSSLFPDRKSQRRHDRYCPDPTFPKWHAVGRQDRQLSLIDQAFWGLDGACMGPNARMRAGRSANPHHFGPASPFFSAVDRPVLPLSFSCCQDRGHAHIGGARNR